jgi:hypothetical protein
MTWCLVPRKRAVQLLVVEHKREHAVEELGRRRVVLGVQRDDDLAVRVRLERVRRLEPVAYPAVVVDLAVDGQDDGVVGVGQRLRAGLDADDAEPLMAEDRVVADNVAAPVGTAMPDGLGQPERRRLELGHVGVVVARKDSAHGCGFFFCCCC